jgi:amino acid transporter
MSQKPSHAVPQDPSGAAQTDDQMLREFGYEPELKRVLKSFSSFAIVFSFISVSTGIFAVYGLVISSAGPRGIWSWPIVTGGQLLLVLVIAGLAGRIPVSGLSYQWMSRLTNPTAGWILGWAFLGYGLVTAPSVNIVFVNAIAQVAKLNLTTLQTSAAVIGVTLVQAVMMIASTKTTVRVNNLAVWSELISVAIFGIVLVVLGFATADPAVGVSNLTSTSPVGPDNYWALFGSFTSTVLLGAFTYSGFDSAAALADETENPQRAVPLGIIRASLAAAGMGMLFLVGITVAERGPWSAVAEASSPVGFIAQDRLGTVLGGVFVIFVAIAIFANAMLQTMVASRLIWAISRDGRFPGSSVFRRVLAASKTPANAIALATVIEIIVIVAFSKLSDLLVASALIPVGVYGVISFAYLFRRNRFPVMPGGFSLGRFDRPVTIGACVWSVLLLVLLIGRPENHKPALVAAGVFASALVWWLVLRIWAPEKLRATIKEAAPEDLAADGISAS